MNYTDYTDPEVIEEFNHVFELKKKRLNEKLNREGVDKEHAEVNSIKVAAVETDFYFDDKQKELDKLKKAG
jgi:hypothetical protein